MNAKSIIMVLVLMLTMSTKLFAQAGNETEEITLTEIDKDINPNGPRNRAPGTQPVQAFISDNGIEVILNYSLEEVSIIISDITSNTIIEYDYFYPSKIVIDISGLMSSLYTLAINIGETSFVGSFNKVP